MDTFILAEVTVQPTSSATETRPSSTSPIESHPLFIAGGVVVIFVTVAGLVYCWRRLGARTSATIPSNPVSRGAAAERLSNPQTKLEPSRPEPSRVSDDQDSESIIADQTISASSSTPRDRYLHTITQLLEMMPPGQQLPDHEISQVLTQAFSIGYPEVFERCLAESRSHINSQADQASIDHQLQILRQIQHLWEQGVKQSAEPSKPKLATSDQPSAQVPASTAGDQAFKTTLEQVKFSKPESKTPTLRNHYFKLIDQIVKQYLQGTFSSEAHLKQALIVELQQLEPQIESAGERFERCLVEREQMFQTQMSQTTDELVQAKAGRSLRAVNMLQKVWQEFLEQVIVETAITTAVERISNAQGSSHPALLVLLEEIDPNRSLALANPHIERLAAKLKQKSQDMQPLASGLDQGLAACRRLQGEVMGWVFDAPLRPAGFQAGHYPTGHDPWTFWARKMTVVPPQPTDHFFQLKADRPSEALSLPQALFQVLAQQSPSVQQWVTQQSAYHLSDWIELVIVMQFLQRGLVTWFDQQAFDPKAGPKGSISTFLTFASVWLELAIGTQQLAQQSTISEACFQLTLQILRRFSQQPYFPLYGGVFASFSGGYLRMALDYLDVPLKQVPATHTKARILTLLGYSQQILGQYQQAQTFHQQALDISRIAEDRPCEIASLNHLSRICVMQKAYGQAIDYSQRALMLSREQGERLGEANALVNLGFSQVFAAHQQEQADPDRYVVPMGYLQQGLDLSKKLEDYQSQALCHSSLGMAYLTLSQPQKAIRHLEAGLEAATASGDLYLKGLNCANLAEAFHVLNQPDSTVYYGCLGLYRLDQIESPDWSQAAGLLVVVRGQMGEDAFEKRLQQQRTRIIAEIGVDGYDHIPELLTNYQHD